MAHRVCPWWIGYFLISPIRRWLMDPVQMLRPFVRPGMTVFEPGPGMGFFTLDLARLVGPGGRVIVSDLQPQMLARLHRRALRAGLDDRIEFRRATAESLEVRDLAGQIDFALAFAMVHEVADQQRFFAQLRDLLRPDGSALLAEPRGHVSDAEFATMLSAATAAGFATEQSQPVRRSYAILLRKRPSSDSPH